MPRMLTPLRVLLRGLLLTLPPTLALLLLTNILLTLLIPIKPFISPATVYNISSCLILPAYRWLQYLFEHCNGAKVTFSFEGKGKADDGGQDSGYEEGDEDGVDGKGGEKGSAKKEGEEDMLPHGESAIVIANHVAWADFFLIQALSRRCGMLSRTRWVAKRELAWVPVIGWALWAMGMPMVARKWKEDKSTFESRGSFMRGVVDGGWPTWLISFCESTRLTPAKLLASQHWCERTGRPQPQHLLYPRTKGFIATVQRLRRAHHIKAVYDLTIAYQRGREWMAAPTFWEALAAPWLSEREEKGGRGYRFHVHVGRFAVEELPGRDEELAQWLERRWVEKGEWLEETRRRWAAEAE